MKNKLIIAAIALALFVTWIGIHYRIRAILALVLGGLAVFAFVSGTRMILTRRADIPTGGASNFFMEYHRGLGARLWGVLFILMSTFAGMLAVGLWVYGNEPPAVLERLVASRAVLGTVTVGVGAGIGMYGLTRLVAGNAPFVETKLRPFERVLGGVYACVTGSLLMAVGLVHVFAPGALTRMRDAALSWALEFFR